MPNRTDSRPRATIRESIRVQQAILRDATLLRMIREVAGVYARALASGHKILLIGNGGSAADAQHIAAEFVGRYMMERAPLPALALTTDTSALTAIGNDYAFEDVFSRQVEALGSKGDILVGFTTSGGSPNILKAFDVARKKKIVTVGFTGRKGFALQEQSDYCFCVPSTVTPRIQESHTLIAHIICDISENLLAQRPLKSGKSRFRR